MVGGRGGREEGGGELGKGVPSSYFFFFFFLRSSSDSESLLLVCFLDFLGFSSSSEWSSYLQWMHRHAHSYARQKAQVRQADLFFSFFLSAFFLRFSSSDMLSSSCLLNESHMLISVQPNPLHSHPARKPEKDHRNIAGPGSKATPKSLAPTV